MLPSLLGTPFRAGPAWATNPGALNERGRRTVLSSEGTGSFIHGLAERKWRLALMMIEARGYGMEVAQTTPAIRDVLDFMATSTLPIIDNAWHLLQRGKVVILFLGAFFVASFHGAILTIVAMMP